MSSVDAYNEAMEVLENDAKRMEMEDNAKRVVSQARTQLVLGRSASWHFMAAIALRLEMQCSWQIPTAATDGRRILYNPSFFAGMSRDEAVAVIAHEVLHVAFKHPSRMGDRNPSKANVAMDLAINSILDAEGFKLPACGLMPGKPPFKNVPADKSWEWYYDMLPEPPKDGGGKGDDPGGMGGVQRPGDGSEAARAQAEAEANEMIAGAVATAKGRGQIPGSLGRLVEEALTPKVDWKEVLREFVSRSVRSSTPSDYSWARPNRRFVAAGLYLPGAVSHALGDVVAVVDTSGSIGPKQLSRFAAELSGIIESHPGTNLTIIYHDHAVQHVQHWSSQDGPLDHASLEAKGGGGTSHVPPFKYIEESCERPTCVVCLTDLMSEFPPAPAYPVLWAAVGAGGAKGPFGITVEVE